MPRGSRIGVERRCPRIVRHEQASQRGFTPNAEALTGARSGLLFSNKPNYGSHGLAMISLLIKRGSLIHDLRQKLKGLPPPYATSVVWRGVPLPPQERGVRLSKVRRRHTKAVAALAAVDPCLPPTVLTSSAPSLPGEALSASSIQGTNSNLNKLLSVEASTDHQVRRKESSQPP